MPAPAKPKTPVAERPVALTPEVLHDLRRPFTFAAIRFKPQAVNNKQNPTKALVTFYLDARLVAERLNTVVGPENWSNGTRPVCAENGAQGWAALHFPVECRLTIFGTSKVDVGVYQSSSPDDKAVKSAYSDSLKRGAVLFGIGAYLYGGIPDLWAAVEVNQQGKVRGFSDAGKKQIERHYGQALKAMADRFGEPLDHGDVIVESDPVPDDGPAPQPDPEIATRDQLAALGALAKQKGFGEEAWKTMVRNVMAANDRHVPLSWVQEQERELAELPDAKTVEKPLAKTPDLPVDPPPVTDPGDDASLPF